MLVFTQEQYEALIGVKKKRTKYRNHKVYVFSDGTCASEKIEGKEVAEIYDSKKEYLRSLDLKMLERAGQISDLKRQVKFVIEDTVTYNGETVRGIFYYADFTYQENGVLVVEDVKPFDENKGTYRTTKDFNLKWKLLKARYPNNEYRLY